MLNILRYKDKEFYSQINQVINSRKSFDEKISKNVSEIITNIKNKNVTFSIHNTPGGHLLAILLYKVNIL